MAINSTTILHIKQDTTVFSVYCLVSPTNIFSYCRFLIKIIRIDLKRIYVSSCACYFISVMQAFNN